MAQRADEVKVGVLVVLVIVLLVFTVLSVSRSGFFRIQPHIYKVQLSFAGGLAQGSVVRFGGLSVGRVESIRILPQQIIEVEVTVKSDTPVRKNSEASVTSLGLLGDNYVEITLGTLESPLLPSGEYLKAKQTSGAGMPDIMEKVNVGVGDIQKLIKDLNVQVNEISAKAKTLLTDMDTTFSSGNQQKLSSILAETDNLIKEASPKVNKTLAQVQSASAKIEPLIENVNGTVKKVDQLVVNLDATVAESRPELKNTLQELDKTLLDARSAILEIRSMMQSNRINLDVLLENLAASSDNIREFTDTVKQQPFSLIRVPSRKPRIPPEIQK
jgi:phospholipid/cholesterol/gamma-HCH transport system substrate-binding protein